jgi:hypothetical protein
MVELVIGAYKIDIKEDESFSTNYSIADIREPQSRQSSYSKTITVPNSHNNAQAFEHIFELNATGGFNPKMRRDAYLYVDSNKIFEGYAQLKSFTVTDSQDIVYQLVLIGELSTLYGELGQLKINELDWDDLDHELNSTNQENSWTPTLGTGYVYPMIDYGFTQSRLQWDVIDLFPAVFVREYIDRMFAYAGKTYQSDFFDTNFFKSLIIPYNKARMELTDAQIKDRTFRASRSSNQSSAPAYGGSTVTVLFNDDTTAPNFDDGANYDPATGIFTVDKSGWYTLSSVGYVRMSYSVTSPAGGAVRYLPTQDVRVFPRIRKVGGGVMAQGAGCRITVADANEFASTYITADDPTYPDLDYLAFASPPNAVRVEFVNVYLAAAEQYRVEYILATIARTGAPASTAMEFYRTDTNALAAGSYEFAILTGSFFQSKLTDTLVRWGDTVVMETAIPENVNCTDFLTSILRMFNLYCEIDREDPNNYLIEPAVYFYGTNVIDWSKKLDNDSEIEVTPVGALDVGSFFFTYKSDTDYFNANYTQAWGEVYGEIEVDADTDFYKDEKKTELIFSPTAISDMDTGEMPLSTIFKMGNGGTVQPYNGNIRILIWGGLKPAPTLWQYDVVGLQSQYPYAGHLDDPYNPTVDINFGFVRQVFYRDSYQPITWSDNNLYNAYYSQFIEEITHPDSKLLTAWFNLNSFDIQSIDFRSLYFFKDSYWRLHRVYDHNPVIPSLTKCEFLKLVTGTVFTPTTREIVGGLTDVGLPKLVGGKNRDGNSMSAYNDVRRIAVYGEGNYIGRTAENVFITGNNNRVLDGLTNVTIIGTDDLTPEENGIYIGGLKLSTPKIYRALLNQTGTNAPVATVMENTIGAIVWTRVTNGEYRGTLSGAFTSAKTHALIVSGEDSIAYVEYTTNILTIITQVCDTLALTDSLLKNSAIQILVYP